MAQVLMNNKQQGGNDNGRSTLSEFMKSSPPTFTKTAEPLDADDWIDIIEYLLALVNCHKREFRALKQGSGSINECLEKFNLLSRYAPDDVSNEAAKIERFMEGLQQSLQYQLVVFDR
ncbi:hypothetical protein D1007_34434 [Hordeum vulgare]|nr:hypothetical protein D1007_34434 [Hordeum vulgare]